MLLFLISKVREESLVYIEAALKKAGVNDLTPVHGDIIYTIAMNEGLDMKTLAELTYRDKTTVTNIIKKLEATGYVNKNPSQADGRVINLTLTPKANRLKKTLLQVSARFNKKLLTGFTDNKVKQMENDLKRLYRNLQN